MHLRIGHQGNSLMAIRNLVRAPLLCLMMLAAAAQADDMPPPLPALERVTVIPVPKSIADFTLTDQDGRPRAFSSLRGAPALVFFGFTHCPDVCPAALTKLKLLQGSAGGVLRAVRVVMISVDGERDTPAVMKRYLASLSPDFIGLTGNPRAVADIAARFAAVAFKGQPDSAGNYDFFHSSQVFLVDAAGRLRAAFSDASVEDMATVTRMVLGEQSAASAVASPGSPRTRSP
jgi:protein SCO1/2